MHRQSDASKGPLNLVAIVAVAAVAVVAVAVAAFLFLGGDGDQGPTHPEQWDARVADEVKFVESERRLAFLHPVIVDVVDDDAFAEAVGADEVPETDRQHLTTLVDLLAAMALITDGGDEDELVEDAGALVLDGGRGAVYLAAEQRIVVRDSGGEDLDRITRAQVVGALGAALYDQHVGLARVSRLDSSAEASGPRSVAVGVSAAFESRYVDGLPARLQDAHTDASDRGLGDDPVDLVRSLAMLPDDLGTGLIEMALADGGLEEDTSEWAVVDTLVASPPRTEFELLQPWATVDGFERVVVPAPEVDEGVEVLAEGRFGAATLYWTMALRVDARDALAVSLLWAGDAHVLYRDDDGRRCLAMSVVGPDGDSSDRIEALLERWIEAGPSDADAEIERDGRVVTLRSCEAPDEDPGLIIDPNTVVIVTVARTVLMADLRAEGSSRANAVCVADEVLAGIPVVALTEPDPPPEAAILYELLLEDSHRACRNV